MGVVTDSEGTLDITTLATDQKVLGPITAAGIFQFQVNVSELAGDERVRFWYEARSDDDTGTQAPVEPNERWFAANGAEENVQLDPIAVSADQKLEVWAEQENGSVRDFVYIMKQLDG